MGEMNLTAEKFHRLYKVGVPHNKFPITLPDGTYYPDYIANDDTRPHEFLTHFNRVRNKGWADCAFLDLGCSEGSTTLRLGQMGSTVYGVEGRADGIERAKVLREILGFENVHFSVGNVVDESVFREADGVFNSGILYHLEDPVTFMERCAKAARYFMYVDSGHAPRSQEEREKSKFSAAFGRTYTIAYKGLTLDVVDFAEPRDVAEKKGGVRRKPRSGIGNSNSVWLSHASLIALMKELGFPYHELIRDVPIIPRQRTAFFRTPPAPVAEIRPYAKPVPKALGQADAVRRTWLRDIDYLKQQNRAVTVCGEDPLLARLLAELKREGIQVSEVIKTPEKKPIGLGGYRNLLAGRSGLLVLAVPDPLDAILRVTLLDQFEYIFLSFSMAAKLNPGVS